MPDDTALTQFHQQIESEITESARDDAGVGSAEFRENVLTEMLAEELSASGVLESPAVCHYESGKSAGSMKVNGYGVPEEDSRLDLFVTLYHGPADQVATVNAADIDSAFRKAERFLGKALDCLHAELDPAGNQYLMAEHIQRLKGQLDRVCFYLFTNARLAQRKEKERKPDIFGLSATYEVWDLERFRRLRESGTSYESLVVNLRSQPAGGLPCVILGTDQTGFQTCVTVFPGSLLYDLYDEHGARLLELNVRSYLQARGKVNAGILKTLRDSPQDFMAYNNGITVVAEEIVFGPLADGTRGILELRGMQIVNGGQTTASIHRAAKDFQADLSRVFVQGKVTVVTPGRFQDIVPLISRYSNTQNRVTEADLSANHPFHIGIERVSRREWAPDQRSMWFYERARGSYQTAKAREGTTPARRRQFEERYPTNQRFSKEDLARFENAWLGLPYIVSRGGQKNFVYFMHELGPHAEGWEPPTEQFHRYVAKGILFREAQRIVRADQTITAYQINVVAYTVSLLAEKTARRIDLDQIWRMQKVTPGTSATISEWAPVVYQRLPQLATSQGRHVGESFKQPACWDYIRALDLKVPLELEEELVAIGQGENGAPPIRRDGRPLTTRDQNNIARCMELAEKDWLAIADWGQKSNELKEWQRGLARSLAGYAAENWSKKPSDKQAKHGARMIEAARTAGVQ
jgi:hypothetical protein